MTSVPSRLAVHELLGAQDFVRRLAHSLVFEAERVDDVVQEAWLAAVQRPPRDPAAAPGWFGSVLQNLARRRVRDDARRRAREAAAARPEALPSTADVLAREQQRREVVDAVLALPEPYRGTVLARFFDELEPAEIAARRGVPAATVRSQLHRALAMLRLRLDERHGSRQAWAVPLLPLLRAERATGLWLTSAAGALVMAKMLAGAGLLALAVLGLWLLNQDGDAPGVAEGRPLAAAPAAAGPGDVRGSAPRPEERVGVAPAAPARAAATAAGAAGLRGRVVFADGRPAPDRLVRVLGIDGVAMFADAPGTGDERTLALSRGEALTDAEGRFTIAGLAPRARYAVHADAGGPDRTLRFTGATPFPGEVADLGDFVLTAKASIAGRAVDAAGEPVAAAEVLALDLPAALAAALPFDRFDPAHGGFLTLPVPRADAVGDAGPWREHLHDWLARDLFVRADLDREAATATFVVDRLPWLEAVWRELPIARTTTGGDGTFTLPGVEPGANLLIVRKTGLATGSRARVVAVAGERREVGDVRLAEGEELRGVVRDAGGRPLPGAEVRVGSIGALGYRGVAFAEAPVRSDANGAFRITGLGRGRVLVAARAGERAPWHVPGPVATGEDVQLQLPAVSELRVRVTRADGAPLQNLALELFAGPRLHELRRAGLQQRLPLPAALQPDREGVLALGSLPPGCYTVHLAAEGAMPGDCMIVLPQTEPAAVTLAAASSVVARVRDDAGGPVPGAKVYVTTEDARAERVLPADYGLPRWSSVPQFAGVSDAAGEVRLECSPGATLHALHPLRAPASVRVAAAVAAVDLVLPRPGSITGRLFDHGVPADPRRWTIVAEVRAWNTTVPLPDLRAGLASDGSFTFPHVAPAQYRVHAEPLADTPLSLGRLVEGMTRLVTPVFFGEDVVSYSVDVVAGATANVDFDVDPNRPKPGEQPARLHGVARVDGAPLAGRELQRCVDDSRWITLATVQDDGTFAADALPPGAQRLRLRSGQWEDLWEGSLELQGGEDRFLDLTFVTGSVRGTAAFAGGLSVAKHVVSAYGRTAGGRVVRHAKLEADGAFAFPALPAGEYHLMANGPDGESEPLPVTIAAGVAAPAVQLTLIELPALTGRVIADVPLRGALIVMHTRTESSNWSRLDPLGEDGSFHFGHLQAQVYELELRLGGKALPLEPKRFDLALGSHRDVLVRVVPAAK